MELPNNFKKYLVSVVAVSAVIFSASSFAGAFQLWEESASSLGDYHAGAAATADNASTVFYNPAGMSRLKHQQVSFGAVFINLGLWYTGSVTLNNSTFQPYPNHSWGGTFDVVPNFHYVDPINNRWAFGIDETTPFGLATNYKDTYSTVGMLATETKLQTININPSLSYAINHHLSVGAGFDVLQGSAIYDDSIGFLGPLTTSLEGYGYGYNVGVLMQFTPETRMGLSYRSAITIDAKGSSAATDINSNPVNSTANADFPLPATTMFSIYHNLNHRVAVMASAFYTQWSVFKELIINNMATPQGVGTVAINENYRNTWNFALGSRYRVNSKFSVEAGVGHDDTPTEIPYRDIRLPDASRYVGSLGVNYYPRKTLECSVGWTHLFVGSTLVNNSGSNDAGKTISGVTPAIGIGVVNSNVNIYGIQITWDI